VPHPLPPTPCSSTRHLLLVTGKRDRESHSVKSTSTSSVWVVLSCKFQSCRIVASACCRCCKGYLLPCYSRTQCIRCTFVDLACAYDLCTDYGVACLFLCHHVPLIPCLMCNLLHCCNCCRYMLAMGAAHTAPVTSLVFDPAQGSILMSASLDGGIATWSLLTQ
jgi:WD40 repeat protein